LDRFCAPGAGLSILEDEVISWAAAVPTPVSYRCSGGIFTRAGGSGRRKKKVYVAPAVKVYGKIVHEAASDIPWGQPTAAWLYSVPRRAAMSGKILFYQMM
jgi:hypothetical protein